VRPERRCEVAVIKEGISVRRELISPLAFKSRMSFTVAESYSVVIQTWLLSGEMFPAASKAFTV
jgi:hypothetical protein